MDFAPIIDPLPALRLPLRRVTMLAGPRDIPFGYPDDRGVLISRPGNVAMPIAVPPVASSAYMHYRAMATRADVATGLVCYGSAM